MIKRWKTTVEERMIQSGRIEGGKSWGGKQRGIFKELKRVRKACHNEQLEVQECVK